MLDGVKHFWRENARREKGTKMENGLAELQNEICKLQQEIQKLKQQTDNLQVEDEMNRNAEQLPKLESIRQTIQTAQGKNLSEHELNFRISWEISKFCDSELPGVDRLPSVVTLTGTTTQAQADSCEDFVQKIWGTKDLLDWLVKALQGHSL